MGFRGTPIDDKDSYALDVLATILGDGRSSVLNQVLKEKKRIAFSVDAGNSTYRDDGIFMYQPILNLKNVKLFKILSLMK